MNIYIVIPAHNEANSIGLMLDSLTQQTVLPHKVLVVNDHSTDATRDYN
ncbi:glycosyltransferase family 2 protein [Lacinutrix neustonica]|nr:glycosyltransferase family A protein [Lacinutrix neustonica]